MSYILRKAYILEAAKRNLPACEICFAGKGQPCRTPTLKTVRRPHKERFYDIRYGDGMLPPVRTQGSASERQRDDEDECLKLPSPTLPPQGVSGE